MAKASLLLVVWGTLTAVLSVQSFSITAPSTHNAMRPRRAVSLHMTKTPDAATHKPRKIVIVGGGIGGLSSAYDARHLLPTDEITVISARESFEFTPSNPWVAVGKRRPEDIRLSLSKILPKHKIKFVHDRVAKLKPGVQQLQLSNGTFCDYDFLIIATGPRLAFDEVPGAGPDHHSVSICSTSHAIMALEAFEMLVENPGPVVVGALQGASCFGPAYEYAMLLRYELERRGGKVLADQCPITFVTPEPYIGHLGLQGAGDSKTILSELMQKRNIKWIPNCSVDKIRGDAVQVSYLEQDINVNDEGASKDTTTFSTKKKTLPSKLTMVIPPFRGPEVWSSVPGLTDETGLILVDEHQQSNKYPTIFGVGVCVSIPPVETTIVPTGPPKTGYMIESMGTAAVKNIKSMIQQQDNVFVKNATKIDNKMIELHYQAVMHGLCITDFGDDGAVFISLPQMPPRRTDLTIHGKLITLAKVAFEKYFLHKIESGDTDPVYEKYMLHLVGVERTLVE